jgi:hypothetical protein
MNGCSAADKHDAVSLRMPLAKWTIWSVLTKLAILPVLSAALNIQLPTYLSYSTALSGQPRDALRGPTVCCDVSDRFQTQPPGTGASLPGRRNPIGFVKHGTNLVVTGTFTHPHSMLPLLRSGPAERFLETSAQAVSKVAKDTRVTAAGRYRRDLPRYVLRWRPVFSATDPSRDLHSRPVPG